MTESPAIETLTSASLRRDQVWYVAAPLRPSESDRNVARATLAYSGTLEEVAVKINVARAKRWLAWLRKRFPEIAFIAPWITAIESAADDTDAEQRERGLRDCCRVVRRCDGAVWCGGRISDGMRDESHDAAAIVDLTTLGPEPPS